MRTKRKAVSAMKLRSITSGPPSRSRLLFLDLPPEIRCMIYKLLLTSPRGRGIRPRKSPLNEAPEIRCIAARRPPRIRALSLERLEREVNPYPTGTETFAVSLLRVCKLIHNEAAPILYGSDTVRLDIGLTNLLHRSPRHLGFYDFEDTLKVVAPDYMKMMRKCEIHVNLPLLPLLKAERMYLKIKERLAVFAAAFDGDDHSLRELRIDFNTDVPYLDWFRTSPLNKSENVMEPLGLIYDVGNVSIRGVSHDLAVKILCAMTSKVLVCEAGEGKCGTRMVRARGMRKRKVPQIVRLDHFDDPKYSFSGEGIVESWPIEDKLPLAHAYCFFRRR